MVQDTIGWIHFKLGNLDDAHDYISKAIEKSPDNAVINFHMGVVLDRQGKEREARLYLEKSLVSDNEFLGSETAKDLLEKYNNAK